MSDQTSVLLSTLLRLGTSLSETLLELIDTSDGDMPLIDILGADLPDEADWPPDLDQKAQAFADILVQIPPAIQAVSAGGDDIAARIVTLVRLAKDAHGAGAALVDSLSQSASFVGALSDKAAEDGADYLQDVLKAIIEWVLLAEMRKTDPSLFAALSVLGVVEFHTSVDADAAAGPDDIRATDVVARMPLENIVRLLSDPMGLIADAHGWGRDDFDPELVFKLVAEVFESPDFARVEDIDGDPVLRIGTQMTVIDRTLSPPGLKISDSVTLTVSPPLPPVEIGSTGWQVEAETTLSATGGYEFALKPPLDLTFRPPTGAASGKLSATFGRTPAAQARPLSLVGGETSVVGVTLKNAMLGAALEMSASTQAPNKIAPSLSADVKDLAFQLSARNADGFLAQLLPPDGIGGSVDLGATWTPDKGVVFRGGGALSATFGVQQSLGPVRLSSIDVRLVVGQDTALKIETSVGLGAALGPFDVTIERMGAELNLDSTPGNLGPFDAGIGFKPPSGLGLKIDSGVVAGGGYLSFDFDRGEYAGTLQLKIGEIEVAAIGLLQTRMPDGQPGFSLVLIITAEFPALQLGFGFALNGLGGLLGVNRTTDADALRRGLRDQSLDAILFPDDPVRNARQIIAQLGSFMPVRRGQHVLGPMVALTWGTPSVLRAELGLFLELASPLRLILAGRLKLGLPSLEVSPQLVKINMDVLGIIDFDARFASLDAVLYDSRVGPYTLEGEMAMRLRWGDDPMFALSLGGLHPAFPRPAELPDLKRMSLSLGNGNNPRLRLEAYLAVTSNSFQVGAALDLYAAAAGFWVKGHLGFDALFIFDPFSFVIEIRARAAIGRGGTTLAGVRLSFTLSGPQPWRAKGKATLSILFFDVSVGFDVTFGDAARPALPAGNPAAALITALSTPANWTGTSPEGVGVLLREAAEGPGLFHPMGRIGVRQTVVPLDLTLEKFGSTDPGADRLFRLRELRLGVGRAAERVPLPASTVVREHFAPAQFLDMDDAEKLSAPSFEEMAAGFAGIDGGGLQVPAERVEKDMGIQTLVITAAPQHRRIDTRAAPPQAAVLAGAEVSGAAMARAGQGGRARYGRASMGLGRPSNGYTLAMADDLTEVPAAGLAGRSVAPIPELDGANAQTRSGLRQALSAHLRRHPQDAERLIIIGRHELPGAA